VIDSLSLARVRAGGSTKLFGAGSDPAGKSGAFGHSEPGRQRTFGCIVVKSTAGVPRDPGPKTFARPEADCNPSPSGLGPQTAPPRCTLFGGCKRGVFSPTAVFRYGNRRDATEPSGPDVHTRSSAFLGKRSFGSSDVLRRFPSGERGSLGKRWHRDHVENRKKPKGASGGRAWQHG